MIGFGLDSVVKGRENQQKGFEPLPDGKYVVEVEKIEDWKAQEFKDAEINVRDADGKIVKGADGKNMKVKADFTAYSANITFTVIDGEFTGRKIFGNVTTHPDVLFLLEGFLFAVNKKEIVLTDLQKECINKRLIVEVYTRETTRTKADPHTGMDVTITAKKNAVRNFLKLDLVGTEDDLGL